MYKRQVEYIVQTDDGGVATLNVSLSKGNHAVLSKNLNSGEEIFNTIHVMEDPDVYKRQVLNIMCEYLRGNLKKLKILMKFIVMNFLKI